MGQSLANAGRASICLGLFLPVVAPDRAQRRPGTLLAPWALNHMNSSSDFLGRLARGLLRVLLGVAATIFLLSLLVASLVVVLAMSLWSLITGRKPAPVVMFQQFRQAQQRYASGVFRGAAGGDVVDVQATEVREGQAPAQPTAQGGPITRLDR